MQRQISVSIFTFILLVTFSLSSVAQQAGSEINSVAVVSKDGLAKVNSGYPVEARAEEYVVPDLVEKSFSKIYPDAINSKWTRTEKGSLVNCVIGDQETTAFFRENGKMNYSITRLNVTNIPSPLQNVIKNEYNGYHVIQALKICADGITTHQVVLEDAKNYVTLKSNGDEIEVVNIKNASAGQQD